MLIESKRCHIVKTPVGTYAFVGSIPFKLGDLAKPSQSDVAGGRSWFNEKTGESETIKFKSFPTGQDAYDFAIGCGVKIMSWKKGKRHA